MGVTVAVRRIGLFGGAFDPPHLAHRALVQASVEQLELERLHVVPTGQAWHKARPLSPAADRLAMAQLAFGDLRGVVVDDREIRRSGPSYTIDTLEELHAEHPQAQLVLVIGADQAAALGSWHRAADIVRLAIISVAARAGQPGAADASVAPSLGAREIPLQLPPLIHSATDIRRRVAAGLGIDHVVVPSVARYIEQHHLYTIA